ncbi:MAG: hypothetical protein C0449_11075 [Polaromonas sp.]|nr:hypothetical protein [Polaromonas sp.]
MHQGENMPISTVRKQVRVLFMLGMMSACSSAAWAQAYTCTTSSGSRYLSKLPCPAGAKPPPFTYHGPKPVRPNSRSPAPASLQRAGDELAYMSPRCASMQEAIRTAPARSIDSLTVRDLRRNFDLECQDERQRALQKLSSDKRERRQQTDERLKAEEQQQVEMRQSNQKLMEQCAEMRRSLQQRQQRPSLSEGEVRDLTLFQDRYQQRCVQTAAR